jgi:CRISPR-associated exonuclease Cas4
MNDESQLIPISALSQWGYCPRRCALIHLEQIFEDNIHTLRGEVEHERVHQEEVEHQDGVCIERGLPLWSKRLGLIGKADIVEFHDGAPYPVEYKHSKRRYGRQAADLQLCGQAICLEEMTGLSVPRGAIFHFGSRRRREVLFDENLRRQVEHAANEIRSLLAASRLPAPVNDARCGECSLKDSCLPSAVGEGARLRTALRNLFRPLEEHPRDWADG